MKTAKEILEIVLKLIQPSRVINQRIEVIEKELSQSKKNDVVLMKSDLLRQFEKCHEKKYRTQHETELFEAMCEEYFKSGGNSFIKDIRDEFLKLELKIMK